MPTYNLPATLTKAQANLFRKIITGEGTGYGTISNPHAERKAKTQDISYTHYQEHGIDDTWKKFNNRTEQAKKQYDKYEDFLDTMVSLGLVQYGVTSWGDQEHAYYLTDMGRYLWVAMKHGLD